MTFSAMFFVSPKKRTKSLAEAVLIFTGARPPLIGVTTGTDADDCLGLDATTGFVLDSGDLGAIDAGAFANCLAFACRASFNSF